MVLNRHPYTRINMCQGMTSDLLQDSIYRHIQELKFKASGGNPGVPTAAGMATKNKLKHLFFIDNLNTATSDHTTGKYIYHILLIKRTCPNKRTGPIFHG